MTTLTNPDAWLDREIAARPLTMLVFFRGSWCPFCQAYLRELDRVLVPKLRAAGGELVAITSQSSEAAAEAARAWKLGYEVRSEPSNVLAKRFGVAITPKAATPLAESPTEYPEGMAQPAVIALDRDGRVLFRWAIDPSTMNLGGASDRPLPDDVWAAVSAAREGRAASIADGPRLDPAFLAAHYPEQHATFQAWVAEAQAKARSDAQR